MLGSDLVGEVGNDDIVGVYLACVTFHYWVETDETVGYGEFDFLGNLLVQLKVDIGVVETLRLEER